MALTLTEFLDELRRNLGNRTDQTDARLVRLLNLCQTRMARIWKWQELERLLYFYRPYENNPAVDRYLPLSTSLRTVYSFKVLDNTNTRFLYRVYPRRTDKYDPYPESSNVGKPCKYVLWARQIELLPVPEQDYTYEMRASVWPTPFSTSSPNAVSDFLEKDDMLLALTTSWAFQSLGSYDKAGKWWTTFTSILTTATSEELDTPDLERTVEMINPMQHATPKYAYWNDPFVKEAP